jgi:hypothetical protein
MNEMPIFDGAGGGTRTPDPRITKTPVCHEGRDSSGVSGVIHSGEQPETATSKGAPVQKAAQAYPGEEPRISLEEAAQRLNIEPKRLLGFCMRNKVGDPISDGRWVYPSSLETLKRRVATSHSSGGAS